MSQPEWQPVTPEALISELEARVRAWRENKYAFQVGLKDLDFEIDADRAEASGLHPPFQTIDAAEEALRQGIITPIAFVEEDDTGHTVVAFSPQPVGSSGFVGCVTHSLALTDHGLFEVGRYPALGLGAAQRTWGWFLHRRLATAGQVHAWREEHALSADQILERFVDVMLGG